MADLAPPRRRSPLGHRAAIEGTAGSIRLAEAPFLGKLILRIDQVTGAGPLHEALGLSLPVEPLATATAGDLAALWLGPDEWMLVGRSGEARIVQQKLAAALAGLHHQLVDVGDYYTVVELAGPKARELLMKLTTLDLHPRAFRGGMVTGSLFGRANATLWQSMDDAERRGPAFRLFIRWSMADYLWCALADAGREWGMPEQVPVKGETLVVA